jgi:hypothetical protein
MMMRRWIQGLVVLQRGESQGKLHDEDIKKLPTWSEIEYRILIGKEQKILGLDRCESYRNSTPRLRRVGLSLRVEACPIYQPLHFTF